MKCVACILNSLVSDIYLKENDAIVVYKGLSLCRFHIERIAELDKELSAEMRKIGEEKNE